MPVRVSEVAGKLIRHPIRNFVLGWNWKSALLSPLVRGGLIFAANASAGSTQAVNALTVEVLYRALIAGFCGSIVEAFRSVEPYWAGQLTVLVAVPVVSDAIDILVHRSYGTPKLAWTVAVSLSWTATSTAFNYFAMRRGALIVGSGRRSLFQDLAILPALLIAFVSIAVTLLFGPQGSAMPIAQDNGLPTVEMILERMRQHENWQNRHLIEYQVQRTFYATNVRFNLESTLEVKTVFRRPNLFDSQVVRSEGSALIREKAFDKILDAEKEAYVKGGKETAITPENYYFEGPVADNCAGRTCYRMKITPKRKDKFSLEGQIWVDAEDGAITRIQAAPARRPSFWTLHTEIERRYERIGGVWLCNTMQSTSDIFIGGHSTLRVDYDYISVLTEKSQL